MKRVFLYAFLSLIWFKYFTIIPKPIHGIPIPLRIISTVVTVSITTEESSTSSDPASNDVSGDPTSPGDSGEF